MRSPAVHHPDPNPHQLRTFAEHRHSELFPPYDRPGTKLFNDFCAQVVRRWQLADKVYPAKVIQILPIGRASGSRFQLVLNTGETIITRRVVLATGSGKIQLPHWVDCITSDYPSDRLCHSLFNNWIDKHDLLAFGESKSIIFVHWFLCSGESSFNNHRMQALKFKDGANCSYIDSVVIIICFWINHN